MKNWVILFTRTGFEEKLLYMLKKKLDANEYLPFVPSREKSNRCKGIITKEYEKLFPGYVFLQSEVEADLIAEKLKLALMHIAGQSDIYSILHYGEDKKDVAMHENERLYWEDLFNENFCITGSIGFIEGDMIRITSGALVGMESRIKWINRHKREAVIQLEMMGAMREVRVMLEIITKT